MPESVPSHAQTAVPMLDFARQYQTLRAELLAAIEDVCDTQRFVLGPAVLAFEAGAAAACAVPHATGCASGTDALWLALAAAGIGNSADPARRTDAAVVTTPFSFFASSSAVVRAGARPVFADIDPRTFNLAPAAVEAVLARESGIRALLPVHLYGQCADFDAFPALAERHGLLLVEDAAQAFGAAWEGRPAGSLGDAAAFSFYPTKNLSAFGDAGLLTTRSSELAAHAESLRAHGMRRRYFHDEVGWNSRLDSIQAAVLGVKLRYLPSWNARRRELAALYRERFVAAGLGVEHTEARVATVADGLVLPWTHPRVQHVFHQYVLRAPRRDELAAHLRAAGIGCEIYYPLCLHQQAALTYLGYRTGDFPEAERAAAEVLALPMYSELREDEVERVVAAIADFYR